VHQFDKVELVRYCRPEESADQLELLTRHAETVLERLELPYRRILLPGGDLGFSNAITYDLEVWSPGVGRWLEVSSCSSYSDYQARRANIRFREQASGKPAFLHTLNGSGVALARTLVAILENRREPDGSVSVPDVLIPYTGFDRLSPP
jgi:seryl-tRNA synthetase